MVALAQRYANNPTVIGFDMFNEPGSNGFYDPSSPSELTWNVWRTNVLSVVRAIHSISPDYLCFVEPLRSATEVGDMQAFADSPLPEPNIVYSAHNYYAWDYPWYDYAKNYAAGNFALAAQQMEQLYYQRWMFMVDANLPVINMETGVYKDTSLNPNWSVWESDSLSVYEKLRVNVCWYQFDPDRPDSTITSLLRPDSLQWTDVGNIWVSHMGMS